MNDPNKKMWFNLGAIGLAVVIIVVVIWAKVTVSPEQEEAVGPIKPPGDALPMSLQAEPLVDEVTEPVQEAEESVQPLPEGVTVEQLKAKQKEYYDLVLEQRQQLEKEYLGIARELFQRNPMYTAGLERKDDWPFEQFGTAFQRFELGRAEHLKVLSGKAEEIDTELGEIASLLSGSLSLAVEAQPEFREKERALLEKFAQLDQTLDEFKPDK